MMLLLLRMLTPVHRKRETTQNRSGRCSVSLFVRNPPKQTKQDVALGVVSREGIERLRREKERMSKRPAAGNDGGGDGTEPATHALMLLPCSFRSCPGCCLLLAGSRPGEEGPPGRKFRGCPVRWAILRCLLMSFRCRVVRGSPRTHCPARWLREIPEFPGRWTAGVGRFPGTSQGPLWRGHALATTLTGPQPGGSRLGIEPNVR